MRGFRRRRGGNFALMMLAFQLYRVGIDNIPPATLSFLAANLIIHLMNPLHYKIRDVCIGSYAVIHHFDVKRLILASFYHLGDFHLYYNMTSLVFKGRTLEHKIGTKRMAFLMIVLAVVGNLLMVAAHFVMDEFLGMPGMGTCAVGFSGVLFGLKVVLTHNAPPNATSSIWGIIRVPTKYVYWAELVLISIVLPNVSFMGHLCGIAAGLMYTWGLLDPLFYALNYIPDVDLFGLNYDPRAQQDQPDHDESPRNTRRRRQTGGTAYDHRPPPENPEYTAGRRVVRDGVLYQY